MSEGYSRDLAYIHDAGFRDFALKSAPGLLRMLRDSGISGGLVVDLGCGGGLWARQLVDAGYDVLGIDISRSMLAIARRRVPEAVFRRQWLLSARVPRCRAVTCLGECLNYLFDVRQGWSRLVRLFQRVHRALEPGGIFVFDIAEPRQVLGPGPRLTHSEGEDWAVLVRAAEDRNRKLLTRNITTFRRIGHVYRRNEETHRLRLMDSRAVVRELRRVGFAARIVRSYGRFRLRRAVAGVVARKA